MYNSKSQFSTFSNAQAPHMSPLTTHLADPARFQVRSPPQSGIRMGYSPSRTPTKQTENNPMNAYFSGTSNPRVSPLPISKSVELANPRSEDRGCYNCPDLQIALKEKSREVRCSECQLFTKPRLLLFKTRSYHSRNAFPCSKTTFRVCAKKSNFTRNVYRWRVR